MSPAEICRQVHKAGMRITANGEKLVVGPSDRLTPELRQLLVDHKPALLVFLVQAHVLAADLLRAAMQACDHHGDDEPARRQMCDDCMATPLHLRADLLAHFRQVYGTKP